MNPKGRRSRTNEDHHLVRQAGGDQLWQPLQGRMNRLFDHFFGSSASMIWNGNRCSFIPQVDVSELEAEIRVTADLPGLDEKNVSVELRDHILTIKGEKKDELEEKGGKFWRIERDCGYFERWIELPKAVVAEKVIATINKGVLKVTIPKKGG